MSYGSFLGSYVYDVHEAKGRGGGGASKAAGKSYELDFDAVGQSDGAARLGPPGSVPMPAHTLNCYDAHTRRPLASGGGLRRGVLRPPWAERNGRRVRGLCIALNLVAAPLIDFRRRWHGAPAEPWLHVPV